jgi:RNA polymerase sigma-70 factor, ECF subfamily
VSEAGKTRGSIEYSNPLPFSFGGTSAETRESKGVDDTALVRRAQRGDTAAFEEVIRHYDQAILCFALHLTGSQQHAQDIYQESLLRAYTNLPRFRFECSFYTWIFRIVANRCLEFLHANKFPKPDGGPLAHPERAEHDGKQPDYPLPQSSETVARALAKLSPRERVVFELKHYHGLGLVTVADLLNISEAIIRNTLLRAAHKLRIELSGLAE